LAKEGDKTPAEDPAEKREEGCLCSGEDEWSDEIKPYGRLGGGPARGREREKIRRCIREAIFVTYRNHRR